MQSRLAAAELAAAADPLVIALACAGDDGAFAEIVRRRQARVRQFMIHLCRESSLGDDLAQQVFLTAWRSLRLLRSVDAFDAWLRRIMINTWIGELRRRKFRYAGEPAPDHFGSVRDTTAERMDLDQALAMLPEVVRLCVVLAYNDGMSHSEIARATRLPLGTVKSNIARGAARLRELLPGYAGE
jgi:RNA polymerase sigma-70 factor (ECF subfamily)